MDILTNAVTVEEASLSSLYGWLQYEKHTWLLGGSAWWVPYSLVLMAVSLVAIIFTPYMLWHLFQAKWYKTIGMFCVIVILPFAVSQFLQIDSTLLTYTINFLPLITFYLFTYIISYLIGEHLEKLRTIRRWENEHPA